MDPRFTEPPEPLEPDEKVAGQRCIAIITAMETNASSVASEIWNELDDRERMDVALCFGAWATAAAIALIECTRSDKTVLQFFQGLALQYQDDGDENGA